jgi:hypothetical protein
MNGYPETNCNLYKVKCPKCANTFYSTYEHLHECTAINCKYKFEFAANRVPELKSNIIQFPKNEGG